LSHLDILWHLLSFLAPAFVVAPLVAWVGRVVLPRAQRQPAWWVLVALNFLVGVLVLVAGLLYFGRDGKMATYTALVIAVATSQWLAGRAWRN